MFTLTGYDGKNVSFDLKDTYTVIDYDNNTGGHGMEAVLLRNDTTGQFVIAFRGTQEAEDYVYDVTTGLLNYNPQISDAMAFVQKALDNPDYNISASNLTLTGHSLGGILTQSVGATLKIPGYTFNAWASSNLIDYSNYLLDPLGLIHRVASLLGWGSDATAFAERNILNLSYTDSGMFNGDPLSNVLSGILGLNEFLGAVLPIFGEDLNAFDGHRMPNMIAAINHYNILLNHFDNKDFLVLTMAYVLSDLTGKNNFYEKGENFFIEAGVYDQNANNLSFNFLDDLSAFQIEQQAKSDRAVLFALIRLKGFAVEGSLSSYSSLNLAEYSSLYIEDRSLLLYHMLDPDNRDLGDLHIKDRGYGVEVGSDGWIWDNPNILFGFDGETSTPEELIGGSKADHLFGMGGDDLLVGDSGNDYLEGGQGSDILLGGKDFDTYIAGDSDTIMDEDGLGVVSFENTVLTGGKLSGEYGNIKTYEGDGGIYILQSNGTLIFSKNGNYLTINGYHKENNDLGIVLEGAELELSIFAPIVSENVENGIATGAITLSRSYEQDIIVTMYTQDDTATAGEDYVGRPTFDIRIPAGLMYAEFNIGIKNDEKPESTEQFYALVESVRTSSGESVDFTLIDAQPFTIEDGYSTNQNPDNPDDPTPDPKYVTMDDIKSNFSFVHRERVEPYTYIPNLKAA
ncbi:MAG: Calx-beta domain-containing protein [Sulfuricurvum sp.]